MKFNNLIMKKIILSLIVSLFDIFIIVSAQTIELIPNLNDNDNVYWGTKNVLNNNNPYMRIEYKGNWFFVTFGDYPDLINTMFLSI